MPESNLRITVTKTIDSDYIVAIQSDISYLEIKSVSNFGFMDAHFATNDLATRLSNMLGLPVKYFSAEVTLKEVRTLA